MTILYNSDTIWDNPYALADGYDVHALRASLETSAGVGEDTEYENSLGYARHSFFSRDPNTRSIEFYTIRGTALKAKRVEVTNSTDANVLGLAHIPDEAERWYSISIFVPEDHVFSDLEEVLWQMHTYSWGDCAAHGNSAPSSALGIWNNRWYWQHKTYLSETASKVTLYLGQEVEPGTWNDWVMNIKTSPVETTTAFSRVWHNGNPVQNETLANNSFCSDETTPSEQYLKFGIYKWDWVTASADRCTSRHYFHAGFRVGDDAEDLASMSPLTANPYPPKMKRCRRVR